MSALGTAAFRNQSAATTNWHFAFNFRSTLVVLQNGAATWKLFAWVYEFSPPAVTTDGFRKDVAKKTARDWANFLGLDVVRYFILFGFWFMIPDCQLVEKNSHNRTFLHAFHVYRLYFLCPTHTHTHTHTHTQVVLLASRKGSDYNPTHHQGGGTRKIQSQKY